MVCIFVFSLVLCGCILCLLLKSFLFNYVYTLFLKNAHVYVCTLLMTSIFYKTSDKPNVRHCQILILGKLRCLFTVSKQRLKNFFELRLKFTKKNIYSAFIINRLVSVLFAYSYVQIYVMLHN